MESYISRWYRGPAFTTARTQDILAKLNQVHPHVHNLKTELCFHVEFARATSKQVSERENSVLEWLLGCPLKPGALQRSSGLIPSTGKLLIECGPRFNFSTAQSSNAVSVCHSAGLLDVVRLEMSVRYLITFNERTEVTAELRERLALVLHDRMTECEYTEANLPRRSFNESLVKKENVHLVDVLGRGRRALEEINAEMGLAFDEADLDYYTRLFSDVLRRNPTNVECFDLAQSNSEHSRHWFFKGRLVVDGVELEQSLIDMIIATQEHSNPNNVIKFTDNSRYVMLFLSYYFYFC